ncbi:stage II sporulation protein E [Clostridium sp. BJN0001]|uniref:stage II sporulation protein E n=1 Tax=Clostridium sp. BJN0001 TaxID=2930219 RepID=UPI001FD35526|nr:stage II sporulation protein E [Clostridium sp. BJN0001]
MQLGINEGVYRPKNNQMKKLLTMNKSFAYVFLILISGFFIGRAGIELNYFATAEIAPFGIAYVIACMERDNKKIGLISAIAVIAGYLTTASYLDDMYFYILSIAVLSIYFLFIYNKIHKISLSFILIFIISCSYGIMVNQYSYGVSFTLSLIKIFTIIPIYYVIKYALSSLYQTENNYMYSSEEIISIVIFISMLLSGIRDINIANISLKSILSLLFVLAFSYCGGAMYGALTGVMAGIVIGISSGDMFQNIAFYSIGGISAGIFKDSGKIFSSLASLIIFLGLGFYSGNVTLLSLIEIMLSYILFLVIPQRLYNKIEYEIDVEKKSSIINSQCIEGLKEEFSMKILRINSALKYISKVLGSTVRNEKLLIKTTSSILVEKLADRNCSGCSYKKKCWGSQFVNTYSLFENIIENVQNGDRILPIEIEKKCMRNFSILKNAESIVKNYNINETVKTRLSESRKILSDYVLNISDTLNDLLSSFKSGTSILTELESEVRYALSKNKIRYNNVFCYMDENNRKKIQIEMDNMHGFDFCEETIAPVLGDIIDEKVKIEEDGYIIKSNKNRVIVTFEQSPKYYVVSYGASAIKKGEEISGDSYSFTNTKNGKYMIAISDGMGSGPDATSESRETIDFVEKFINAGFDEDVTVNMVNSIMDMKFAESEKYSTLDLCEIDLYNGQSIFIKIGSVCSFIKRGKKVKVINSKNLPFGIVDKVDVEKINENLMPGDIIITVTDGVLDIDKVKNQKFLWIEEYLKGCMESDPRAIAEDILDKCKILSENKINDDMTIIASKIYEL